MTIPKLNYNFKTRLIIYTVSLVFLVALLSLGFYVYQINNSTEQQLVEFGSRLSQDLAFSMKLIEPSENPDLMQTVLQRFLKKDDVVMVAVYGAQGDSLLMMQHKQIANNIPSEIRKKLSEKQETLTKKEKTNQGAEVYSFYSVTTEQDRISGFSKVAISLNKIKTQRRKVIGFGTLVVLLISSIGSFIAYFLATKIIEPIHSLTEGAEEISEGNLNHRIKIKSMGEIKELAETFNQMADSLQKSREKLEETKKILKIRVKAKTRELRELNHQLEKRVKKRTQELQHRVEDLERFHRLAVGRETRMIELKEKIEELKKKLKQKEKDEN